MEPFHPLEHQNPITPLSEPGTPPAPQPDVTTAPYVSASVDSHVAPVSDAPRVTGVFSPSQPVVPITPPSTSPPNPEPSDDMSPLPVIEVYSPHGVEYVFLTITLFALIFGLDAMLLSLVNGDTVFTVLAYPSAVLVVAVPIFALLFLRLKKLELIQPTRRFDASKRRNTQIIQIINFLICFFTLIGLMGTIFAKAGGDYHGSVFKVILDVVVLLIVSGGVLWYYWHDEHSRRH